jgi:hypothetical protein
MMVSSRRKERMRGTVAVRWNACQPADARGHIMPGPVSVLHAQDVRRVAACVGMLSAAFFLIVKGDRASRA